MAWEKGDAGPAETGGERCQFAASEGGLMNIACKRLGRDSDSRSHPWIAFIKTSQEPLTRKPSVPCTTSHLFPLKIGGVKTWV